MLPTVQGSGTTPWTGGVYQDSLTCWYGGNPGYCGPNAIVRPGNNINFSYGSTYLYQQQQASNLVPANALNITGYNFSFTAKNGNGWDGGGTDTLSALVRFWDATGNKGAGNLLYGTSYNLSYNTQGWRDFNYNETLPTPLSAKSVGLVQYGFIGRDNNGWAGPYGPEINNVNFSLKYSVDPCATNPAYSPNCSGFNTVATSNNLVSNPSGYAVFGSSVNQSYAINTALAAAGSAAQIHGFQWGYTANANGPYCAVWMLVCFDERTPKVQTHVSITDSNGGSLYSVSRNYENSYNNTNYSYLFPASKPMSTLGNFNFSATAYDSAYVGNMYSRALYTADPCAVNPLSSPTCSGYGAAFAKTLSTASTTTTTTAPALAPLPPALAEAAPALAEAAPALASPTAQTAPPPAAPPPPVQDTAVAQSDPAQPSPTQAGPAPTGPPAPAGGPPQTATASASSSTSSGPSTSSAGPSKLAMSVLKTAQANDKATQTAAVQAAAKTLETATQSSQASSNMAISMNQDMSANSAVAAAQFASQATQASQQTAVQVFQSPQTVSASSQTQQASKTGPQVQQQTQQDVQQVQSQGSNTTTQLQAPQQTQPQVQMQTASSSVQTPPPAYTPPQQQQDMQSSSVVTLRPPMQVQVDVQQQASSGTGLTVSRNPFAYSPLSSVNSSNVAMFQTQPAPTFQSRIDTRQLEVETPQVQVATFGGVGKAGNPLSDMMQQKFELMQDNISQSTSSVNRNVQPNDLAGKVDLAAMATVPAGFTAYSFVLRDAAFYEPKEVYKNQKTVDNVRILRGLTGGSDALHQRMVDSQYK